MGQYMLAVHHREGEETPSDDVLQQMYADVGALNDEMMAKGVWVFGGGLEPRETATVVTQQDGEVITTDGPFIEAKEWLGGFWVLELPDLDEALAWARRATIACRGPVEVRPFQDEPED